MVAGIHIIFVIDSKRMSEEMPRISEIFPLGVRGSALSTAAMVNFGSNILMTLCQTALMDALTPAGAFFLYLFFALLSILFVAYMVPETKGKTLEERRERTK